MTEEIWKDIEGYENLYQVSNMGRVRSLDRWVSTVDGKKQLYKSKILTSQYNEHGYNQICLSKNGTTKTHKLHRLIAKAFLPNPENKPCIDHINTIRTDNRVENLRWCTHSENLSNSITKNRKSNKQKNRLKKKENHPMYQKHHSEESKRKMSKSKTKYILQIEPSTNKIIAIWNNPFSIKKEMGIDNRTLTKCCKGKKLTHKGFRWVYLDNYLADWWDMEMEKEVA